MQENSKRESSLMHNVSGEQKENMRETMHTDASLTNDDEITYAFIALVFRPLPRNVPLVSYQQPLQVQVKGFMKLHYSKLCAIIVSLSFNVLILKVFQSFPPKLIEKLDPVFYRRSIFD